MVMMIPMVLTHSAPNLTFGLARFLTISTPEVRQSQTKIGSWLKMWEATGELLMRHGILSSLMSKPTKRLTRMTEETGSIQDIEIWSKTPSVIIAETVSKASTPISMTLCVDEYRGLFIKLAIPITATIATRNVSMTGKTFPWTPTSSQGLQPSEDSKASGSQSPHATASLSRKTWQVPGFPPGQ